MLRRSRLPSLPAMRKSCLLLGFFALAMLPIAAGAQEPKSPLPPGSQPAGMDYAREVLPLLTKYCHECHGARRQRGDVALHRVSADGSFPEADRGTWEAALQMLEAAAMPPEDRPQPSAKERQRLVDWIESRLFFVDCQESNDPGRVTIRRLNRAEYNNTVRDLLGVDFRPADDFPSDDVGYGFDNIGDVLSLPPLLMEKYLDAAEKIAQSALAAEPLASAPRKRREGEDLKTGERSRSFGSGTFKLAKGDPVTGEFYFLKDGHYLLRVQAGSRRPDDEPARLQLRLDDKPAETFDVLARRDEMQVYEVQIKAEKGKRRLSADFINGPEELGLRNDRERALYVNWLEVIGPFEPASGPEAGRRLMVVRPANGRSLRDAARETLAPFVTRAFRRPASEEELDRLVGLVEMAERRGDSFERGLRVAVTAVLVSPSFLFRVEADSKPDDPRARRPLNDFELATRLSYFLWSSMPDDALFALAARGELHKEPVLREQVRRMLKDSKSWALAENFAAQWLNLGMLEECSPDPELFGSFDAQLKADMRRETLLFFDAVVREDRSILEFIDGRFTFVNERLARHYGLSGIDGEEFRRVALADEGRAGVLTHASVLTLTSNPGRTSPVKRGKWIMENILGTPPPEPPPDVPELEQTRRANPKATLRQQLELHRKDPACATCHRQMDALGFGFENFDAIGRWRESDGPAKIDPSGTLPSGEMFQGPAELVRILRERKAEISRSLAAKLLTFALGRGLGPHDRCAIDEVAKELAAGDYRFSALVTAIVLSEPFRMRRGEGDQP
jgi:hypothetical protein